MLFRSAAFLYFTANAMTIIQQGSRFETYQIIIGIIGMIGCGVNYPIYKKMLAKGKAKYAYEIVQLAREIADK